MTSELKSFVYDPIAKSFDQIRLLRFFDSKTILIFHASLSDTPGYRALSYTWGTDFSDKPLQVLVDVDGELQPRSLIVTTNCMSALERLYEDDCFTPVWIDAICIDQSKDDERNHQVALMSQIYSTAEKVQIDLGPGDEGTCRALNYIKKEYEFQSTGTPLQFFPYTEVAPLDIQKSLSDILSSSWFTRVWVLQEVHFAKYAEVLCGGDKIPWSILRLLGIHYYDNDDAMLSLTQPKQRCTASLPNTPKIPPILSISENRQIEKTLWYWMEETSSLKSTDPRDSVYALLGLASDVRNGRLHLSADYTKTLAEVKALVQKHYALTALNSICINNGLKLENGQQLPLEEILLAVLQCANQSGHRLLHILDIDKQMILAGLRQLRFFSRCSEWWYSCCTSDFSEFIVPTLHWIKSVHVHGEDSIQGMDRLYSILNTTEDWARPFCLHHPLFHDVLISMNKYGNLKSQEDDQQAHWTLAASCIQLMSSSLKEDICGVNAPGTLIADVNSSQVDQCLSLEIQYACLYWVQHLQKSGTQLYDQNQVLQFLQKHLLYWLEALCWIRKLSEGILEIISLESIAIVSPTD
jgi:heterokaryon incompatibility protein (HET)